MTEPVVTSPLAQSVAKKKPSRKKKSSKRPAPRVETPTKQLEASNAAPQTSEALAVQRPQALARHHDFGFTPEQMTLIKDQYAKGTTNEEFAVFIHVCKARKLDPLQKQVYCIMRESDGVQKMTIQVGIDGFRAIANRTKEYAPSEKPTMFEYHADGTSLKAATVFVKKYVQGTWHEYSAMALMKEYEATGKNGFMWKTKPHVLLEKCAEAKALRRGWPEELGQFYVAEEFDASDNPPVNSREANRDEKKNAHGREVGTMKESSQPNRGHGDENLAPPKTTVPSEVASSVAGVKTGAATFGKNDGVIHLLTVKEVIHKPKKDSTGYTVVRCHDFNRDLFCWSATLAALIDKGKRYEFRVVVKEGKKVDKNPPKKFETIADIVSVEGVPYQDGKPYVAPEEGEYIDDPAGVGHDDDEDDHDAHCGVEGVFTK